MTMVRKQIYLDPEVDKRLKREAKHRKISEAALIRERLSIDCEHIDAPQTRSKSRQEFLSRLARLREEAMRHEGTGWKFNRDELYEERTERQMPG